MTRKISLKEIVAGLKHSSPKVRKTCVLYLGRVDRPEVIKLLKPLLNDPDQEVAMFASKVTAYLSKRYNQDKAFVPENTKAQITASVCETKLKIDKLISLLDNNNDIKTRVSAVEAAGKSGDADCLEILIKELKTATDNYLIATLVKSIGRLSQDEQHASLLIDYLDNEDPRVRANTIEAIELTGNLNHLLSISPKIDDPDERVRLTAVHYICKQNLKSILELATPLIENDDSEKVRLYFKILSLFKKSSGLLESLDQLLADQSETFKIQALEFLLTIDSPEATELYHKYQVETEPGKSNDNPSETPDDLTESLIDIESALKEDMGDDLESDSLEIDITDKFEGTLLEQIVSTRMQNSITQPNTDGSKLDIFQLKVELIKDNEEVSDSTPVYQPNEIVKNLEREPYIEEVKIHSVASETIKMLLIAGGIILFILIILIYTSI